MKICLQAGKPTSHDSIKNSFTNLLGLDGAVQEKERLIGEIYQDLDKVDADLRERLREMVEKYFK